MIKSNLRITVFLTLALFLSGHLVAGGKLIGTSGVTQMEGSGGGGMVPWATLSGYDTRDEQSATSFFSYVQVDDFSMKAYGAAFSFYDRLELSLAHQVFNAQDSQLQLSQNIVGAKVKLIGDLIYNSFPQLSLGAQYKSAQHHDVLETLGAGNNKGLDIYLAATKAWLDGPFHRNLVVNLTLRLTKANQLGLQGFGGDKSNNYRAEFETSLGLFLNRHWVVGAEYRQKPNNLSSLKEDDWYNIFLVYIPTKDIAITSAFVELGRLAGLSRQTGGYISIQTSF